MGFAASNAWANVCPALGQMYLTILGYLSFFCRSGGDGGLFEVLNAAVDLVDGMLIDLDGQVPHHVVDIGCEVPKGAFSLIAPVINVELVAYRIPVLADRIGQTQDCAFVEWDIFHSKHPFIDVAFN